MFLLTVPNSTHTDIKTVNGSEPSDSTLVVALEEVRVELALTRCEREAKSNEKQSQRIVKRKGPVKEQSTHSR